MIRNKRLAVEDPKVTADLAASVQASIVEVLVEKTLVAAKKFKAKTVLAGGGVIANEALRSALAARFKSEMPEVALRIPHRKYTTDNATMIATAGYYHAAKKDFTLWSKIKADPNWELV
jgi:N6-L-threonylcarbamoyladenine synthase